VTGEAEWYERVRRVVTLRLGGLCYHTHDSRRSVPGFPDLVIVVGGRILYREVKLGAGRLTAEQEEWLAALTAAGADAAVWRFPADWPAALRELGLPGDRLSGEDDATIPESTDGAHPADVAAPSPVVDADAVAHAAEAAELSRLTAEFVSDGHLPTAAARLAQAVLRERAEAEARKELRR